MWHGGALKGSIWLCYAGPLAGRQKSGISDNQQRQSQLPKKQQLGKLREEEEEPATEWSREYTDLGLDLGEREEQVACHASALALAMIDEARQEAEV